MEKKNLNVTTIEDLKEYSKGALIELPPFEDSQRFFAKLRRPSLLKCINSGRIPNELMATANALYVGKAVGKDDDTDALKEVYQVLELIAKASLISPGYDEIIEADMELTDEQLMFIYNYSQAGLKDLKTFRGETRDTGVNKYGGDVQRKTK